jgi:hypothetical protein
MRHNLLDHKQILSLITRLVPTAMILTIATPSPTMMKVILAILSSCSLLLSIDPKPLHSFPSAHNFSIKDRSIFQPISADRLSLVKDEFSLLKTEQIGKLKIGLSEQKVKQNINCALKRESEQLWGADGAYHQKWNYVDCGITLGMVSAKKGAPKSIESITLNSPSRLSTKRNIRIGSSEKAVMKAYKSEWNREQNTSKSFVAGSVYGGLIFQFQNGKVSEIFLGAAAE